VVHGTLFPIRDVTGSVEDALALVRSVQRQVHDVQSDQPV
jgi:hypothetical protein